MAEPPVPPSKPAPRGSAPPNKPAAPLVGRVVARCRLDAYVGGGAAAVVYRGEHLGLGKPVAVKILRPAAAQNATIVKAFRQEARAIARIDSENVLKVYDVVDEGDLHCMVMELLEGKSVLDRVTEEGHLTRLDALRILRQAALGLAAVHARGIVHRDVKPQNLVVVADGTVKLVDFGLAFEGRATQQRVGTPHFLAPETCDTGHAEAASDVYSLGITLYHLLVGQPPYAGRPVKEVIQAHIQGRPMRLAEERPRLGRDVMALQKAMTKNDPLVRPSAAQVVEAVDRIGGKTLQRKRSLAYRRRRRPDGRVVAGVVAVAAAAAVAAFVLLSRKQETPAPRAPATKRAAAPIEKAAPVEKAAPLPPVNLSPEEVARRERMETEAAGRVEGVEDWARAHWSNRSDTKGVVDRYRTIATDGAYRRTEGAKEAKRRADEIDAGRWHPHPDRAWSPPEEVAAARAAWDALRSRLDDLIEERRYGEALAALPEPVSDPSGELEAELAYPRALLERLAAFPKSLATRFLGWSVVRLNLKTAKGAGRVTAIDQNGFTLTTDDGEVAAEWDEVEPVAIAGLALRLSFDAPRSEVLQLLAFCVAHDLKDAYWQARMDLDVGSGPGSEEDLLRLFEERLSSSPR